jgi:octaprenyl-diphosphate synthase
MNQVMAPDPARAAFLGRIEAALEQSLSLEGAAAPAATLLEGARHLCLGGGAKRVRPLLVRSFGRAVGAPEAALVDLGAAAELIHAASLLHDDVVDEGTLRRGRPTVNARLGNAVAVLAGDLVLSRAMARLRPHPAEIVHRAVQVVAEMAAAALAEVEQRGRADLPLAAWREVAEGKTGRLFGWCGDAAARVAGAAAAGERFASAGRHLGVAFQLADDLADLLPDGGGAGGAKNRFADLRNRSPSYPILLAAQRSPALRGRVEAAWSDGATDGELAALGEAVLAGAGRETYDAAGGEIDRALAALDGAGEGATEIVEMARGLWRRAAPALGIAT